MKKFFLLFSTVLLLNQSFSVIAEEQPFRIGSSGEIVSFENMTIVPVFASLQHIYQNILNYKLINLKDALDQDLIIISERNSAIQEQGPNLNIPIEQDTALNPTTSIDSGQTESRIQNVLTNEEVSALIAQSQTGLSDVNNLQISNKSDKYIYLMAGDLIKGGKQDRVIGKDIIIPPNKEKMDIPVFCVEQHRWNLKGENPNFIKYSNVVSNTVRNAVQVEQQQSEVWSKVSTVQSTYGIKSETGAYSDLENSENFVLKRQQYIDFFSDLTEKYNNLVGMIVATDDSIVGCDIFINHEIFKMQYTSLLHAYVTDVICFGQKTKIGNTKITKFFEAVLSEYFVPPKQDDKAETRFFYNDKIMHFTKFK